MTHKKEYKLRTDLEKTRASALASLSMREHSVKELSEKLKRKDYQEDSIAIVLKECLDNNYLNDERFAKIYWRSRAAKGFGPNKIQHELKFKGVNSEIIEQTKQQDDLDFEKTIQKVYLKKFKNKAIKDFKDKIKRQNYLYQRGFDRELIATVIS